MPGAMRRRLRARLLLLIVLALWSAASCGDSASGPTSPTGPAHVKLSGHVKATMTDQSLPGLAVTLNTGEAARTDGAGAFAFDLLQNDIRVNRLTVEGPSIVSRGVTLAAPSTRDINVDAIEAQAPFELGFYRFLVRNGFESSNLEPLRRWVQSPKIYIRTVDDSEASIPNASLNLVALVLT